ncbi:MAG: hypothetical protein BHV82_06190 [Odoribacter sp. 43_10]|nr:MAG: hypothetical protein BHV82_06190 [Odoribacter sp. 43_10]
MEGVTIGENVVIDKAIIAEDTVIGDNAVLGIGEEKPNKLKESVYAFGLVTIGEKSVIPPDVKIGKNTMPEAAKITASDWPNFVTPKMLEPTVVTFINDQLKASQ